MNFLSVNNRITLGLVSLMVSTMLVTICSGIGPDPRQTVMHGRAKLCESIAINTSILISRDDLVRIKAIMDSIVQRNDDVESTAVRRADGKVIIEIGDHAVNWGRGDKLCTETDAQVPLRIGEVKWGNVELRFKPITVTGWRARLQSPWTKFVLLVAGISFLLSRTTSAKSSNNWTRLKQFSSGCARRWIRWRKVCWSQTRKAESY